MNKSISFGGRWTEQKLSVLSKYLSAYTIALRDKPSPNYRFKKGYIDAFAGSGYRQPIPRHNNIGLGDDPLFPDLNQDEPQELLEGSALRALRTEPSFEQYIFIDSNRKRCDSLETLKARFPKLAGRIDIQHGEANEIIQELCLRNWKSHRAVMFLDPFGLQVEWETIRAVAKTEAIDLWILFPLGIGVNRLLTRSGDIPEEWRMKLNQILGTEDWYDVFYDRETITDLFGESRERKIKARIEKIGEYFVKRLDTVFSGVAKNPAFLTNSTNNPLYLLCFAVGNKNGRKTALRIAEDLLEDIQ